MTDLAVFDATEQTKLVVLEQSQTVHTATDLGLVVQTQNETSVQLVPDAAPEIVSVGTQGPAGTPGPTGNSAIPTAIYLAGESLSGHRAVYISAANQAMYASKDDDTADAVFGITTSAASLASAVEIRYIGVITEPSWNWTVKEPIYLGANGILTQVAPTSGALVELGIALTATSMSVRIQEAIWLS